MKYRIVQIEAPKFIIDREDGQVICEGTGETKVFRTLRHAEWYLKFSGLPYDPSALYRDSQI